MRDRGEDQEDEEGELKLLVLFTLLKRIEYNNNNNITYPQNSKLITGYIISLPFSV